MSEENKIAIMEQLKYLDPIKDKKLIENITYIYNEKIYDKLLQKIMT